MKQATTALWFLFYLFLNPVKSFQVHRISVVPTNPCSCTQPWSSSIINNGIGKLHRSDTGNRRAAPLQAIPSLTQIAASCLIPTSLGFIRYEYGVSYGYGTSVALVASLVLRSTEHGTLPYWHALALLFYGARLNAFLLYREIFIPKFQKFREKIEQRRGNKGPLAKIPFVLGCATLYACLSAPLFITSQLSASQFHPLIGSCIGMSWIGFIVAAWGDVQKSIVKARNGPDTLVTGGIYRFLRHPNYTGEAIGWSCSFLASVLAALLSLPTSWKIAGILSLATLGWMGILLVLTQAATGLERIQEEKYGGTREYEDWVQGSWSGPTFPKKDQSNNDASTN